MKGDIYPATIYLSRIRGYTPIPLLELLRNPMEKFVDNSLSEKIFYQAVHELYHPLLSFILNNDFRVTLVVTGDFIESISQFPELLSVIKRGVERESFLISANSYYGNSLTSLYNSASWADSIRQTIVTIQGVLGIRSVYAYLPQLFRGLEIERLSPTVTNFITRHKSSKYEKAVIKNSELRRFNGSNAYWIDESNDCSCSYYFVPNIYFFDVNTALFDKSVAKSARALSLKIGLSSAKTEIRKTPWKPLLKNELPRLNEKYSLTLYSPLERGIIRLWEYGSLILSSSYGQDPNELNRWLFNQYQQLQNTDYLHFMKKTNYLSSSLSLFNSPYEAFIVMQTAVKQIEILLKNQL